VKPAKRRAARVRRTSGPSPAELEEAACDLHWRLTAIVKRVNPPAYHYGRLTSLISYIDRDSSAPAGKASKWVDVLKEISHHLADATATTHEVGGSVLPKLNITQAVATALHGYAGETLEKRRRERGWQLGRIALRFVRSQLSAHDALVKAIHRRGVPVESADGPPILSREGFLVTVDGALEARPASERELINKVAVARSEATKWNAAYTYLARGADVWPATDSARACRGDRLKLYKSLPRS
jgi:hypothetical protein